MDRTIFKTPLGWAGVAASEQGICRIALPRKDKKAVERELKAVSCQSEKGVQTHAMRKAVKLLQKYFSGKRVSFDLPLDTRSYTPFQQAVWHAAAEIPSGETRSYAWIAKKIRNPRAVRAVGRALGANPIPIIIPCHRVIGSAGTLGGYAGGLAMKKGLLALEAGKQKGKQRV
jgi:methylated-DNA-[protein]-cysteine S-methyltransferase